MSTPTGQSKSGPYFRVTLADGTMHYVAGTTARAVRRRFAREYPQLGKIRRVERRGELS